MKIINRILPSLVIPIRHSSLWFAASGALSPFLIPNMTFTSYQIILYVAFYVNMEGAAYGL